MAALTFVILLLTLREEPIKNSISLLIEYMGMSKTDNTQEEKKVCEETKRCELCKSMMPIDGVKCRECHSFQDMRRHVNFLVPVISLLVALTATAPILVNSLSDYFSNPIPVYSVLTFAGLNVVDDDGDTIEPNEFGISAQLINTGSKLLVVDDSINCTLRKNLYKKRNLEQTHDKESDSGIPSEGALFQFDFYIEKNSHTVLHSGETATIKWTTQTSKKLELDQYLDIHYQKRGQYESDEVIEFYEEILDRAALVGKHWPHIDGDHGLPGIASDKLQYFFSDLDCSFKVSNGPYSVSKELHLEFFYEASGKEGKYPRWRIGKNISPGFGNGNGS